MDIAALKAELTAGHPDTGAYDADPVLAAAEINLANRDRNRTSMTGSEVLNAVDSGEWGTRTAAQKQTVWDIVHLGDVNPFGVEATLMTGAFSGAGGATIAALQAARKEKISQATALGLGNVRPGDIQKARV